MSEKNKMKEWLLLNQAASVLKINANLLKINDKGEVVVIDYPVVMLGEPRKKLTKEQNDQIKTLIKNIRSEINHVVNTSTGFEDKRGKSLSVQQNMLTAFFKMIELKSYYPHLEIFMPEGINDIKPGNLWNYSQALNCGLNFHAKKYIPSSRNSLGQQFGITFQIQHPRGKNHIHSVQVDFKKR